MKVLRLIGGLAPERGGPSVSAVNSAVATKRAGVDIVLACPASPAENGGEALARLRAEGIETITFPYLRRAGGLAGDWGLSTELLGWMRRNMPGFDIVQCHGAWQMVTAATLLMRKTGDFRRVLVPHESLTDYDIADTSRPGLGWVKRRLRTRFLSGFDRVVFSSGLEARDSMPAAAAAGAAGVVVYHPVFDERRALDPLHGTGDGPRGELVVGFLGRLHAKKNVQLLIEALAAAPGNITLRIAGDGAEMGRLRAVADLRRVGERVEWLGFIGENAKRGFLSSIDMLALPSEYECFGMAAAEAMCAGVPVLVSEETGVADVVRAYGGGLVVPRDSASIAAALMRVAEDGHARRAMAARAAEAARAEFSFATHGAAMAACYEALLGQGR